ncbi:hypothetical protein FRUB_01362 [Fimbriiglobus ruber]|uniref:Heat shock protein GrpE n=1 Tax=Fimbriiglobus ruber TaxID=1908690 RepID=A0A225DUM7_9BACT|nr:hypothetical protein FRUB_01362 [Fimbriiglobus ruber]
MVAQFVALRHEVNLQTRAARTAVEQTCEALKLLNQPAKPAADPDEPVRPFVKALIDIADALTIAGRQVERTRTALEPLLEDLTGSSLPEPPDLPPADEPAAPEATDRPGFFARMFGAAPAPGRPPAGNDGAWVQWAEDVEAADAERAQRAEAADEKLRPLLAGLGDGYAMSLRRVDRVLPQFDIEPIDCVGQVFDPELMEVLEVLTDPDQPSGTVAEEVRRGYRWRGKLFRFAQVKVVR